MKFKDLCKELDEHDTREIINLYEFKKALKKVNRQIVEELTKKVENKEAKNE